MPPRVAAGPIVRSLTVMTSVRTPWVRCKKRDSEARGFTDNGRKQHGTDSETEGESTGRPNEGSQPTREGRRKDWCKEGRKD